MTVATAILADIGGTNARFALLVDTEPTLITTYAVANYPSPVEAARAYLDGPAAGYQPQTAVMAAAGPVVNGRISMTNATWVVDAKQIRSGLALKSARVVNDFEALGWALPGFRPQDLAVIGPAVPAAAGSDGRHGAWHRLRVGCAGIGRGHRGCAGDRSRPCDAAE